MKKNPRKADEPSILVDKLMSPFFTGRSFSSSFQKALKGKKIDRDVEQFAMSFQNKSLQDAIRESYKKMKDSPILTGHGAQNDHQSSQIVFGGLYYFYTLLNSLLDSSSLNNFLFFIKDSIFTCIKSPGFAEILRHIQMQASHKNLSAIDSGEINELTFLRDIDEWITKSLNYLKNMDTTSMANRPSSIQANDLKFYAYIIFFWLLVLKEIVVIQKKLKRNPSDKSIWRNAFKMGIFGAIGITMGLPGLIKPEIKRDIISSEGARQVRKKWTPLNELSKDALKIADDEWKKEKAQGEMVWHDEMAQYVLREIKKSKPDLIKDYIRSIQRIVEKSHGRAITEVEWDKYVLRAVRRAIKPAATKYGRLWNASGKRGIE